jgi:hypothetical protein
LSCMCPPSLADWQKHIWRTQTLHP